MASNTTTSLPDADSEQLGEVSAGAPDVRDRRRLEAVAEIPRWYNPWVHLGLTTSVAVLVIIAGVLRIHGLRWHDWLTIPLVLIGSNAFEWRVHKTVLHHRTPPFGLLYERHTPMHHMVYTYDDMSIRSTRELRLVLIPAIGVAGVVFATAPLAVGTSLLFGAGSGWLLLMTSAFYVVAYEWSHLSYHLPPESFVGRMWLVRVLREHHRRHHHPRLMQKWNFNVTLPLWDWVKRTSVPRDVLDRAIEKGC